MATLLQDNEHMVGTGGERRKLVIFTEHRDTLRYLRERITTLFGRDHNIVHIDGSLRREERRAVDQIGSDLLRLRFETEAKKAKKATGELKMPETMALAGLKPWRQVVSPHPDVASRRYLQAEFVADLSQVLAGTAEPEYQSPVEFFRRTYLTEGLLNMLVTDVRRLTAQSG